MQQTLGIEYTDVLAIEWQRKVIWYQEGLRLFRPLGWQADQEGLFGYDQMDQLGLCKLTHCKKSDITITRCIGSIAKETWYY